MATINTSDCGHGTLRVVERDGTLIDFKPYPAVSAQEKQRLAKVEQAVQLVSKLEGDKNTYQMCNAYFRSLPLGLTLRKSGSVAVFSSMVPQC